MPDSLLFVLPDGRSAQIPFRSARLICDRLWELGITPGAALAAARISDALHTHPQYWRDVAFSEREVPPLLEASEVAPPRWSLADRDGPPPELRTHRERLLAKCEALIDSLNSRDDHAKLQAFIEDLERLRDSLRSPN
jgi:hypothetical protein